MLLMHGKQPTYNDREGSNISSLISVIYALPVVGAIALFAPTSSILQGVYSKYVGLELALIGTLLLIIRIVDAIAVLCSGHIFDGYRQRTGTRKPLIMISTCLTGGSGYFLFSPELDAGGGYFLVWGLGFYVSYSLFRVNRTAWAAEITRSPNERTRLFTYESLFSQVGYLVALGFPLLPIFSANEFTPEVLEFIAVFFGGWLLVNTFLAIRHVPDGQYTPAKDSIKFKTVLAQALNNRPFFIYLALVCSHSIALGITVGIEFIIWDSYFGIGSRIALVYVIVLSAGIICLPAINQLIRRFGKIRILTLSMVAYIAFPLAFLFVSPGSQSFPAIAVIQGLNGIALSCNLLILPSLLADVIDFGKWKNNEDQAATYTAISEFFVKVFTGLGAFGGLWLTSFLGFVAYVDNDPQVARQAINVIYCWVPAILQVGTISCVLLMPLTPRRMEIIQKRLNRRAATIADGKAKISPVW